MMPLPALLLPLLPLLTVKTVAVAGGATAATYAATELGKATSRFVEGYRQDKDAARELNELKGQIRVIRVGKQYSFAWVGCTWSVASEKIIDGCIDDVIKEVYDELGKQSSKSNGRPGDQRGPARNLVVLAVLSVRDEISRMGR